MPTRFLYFIFLFAVSCGVSNANQPPESSASKPLFKDFMGINGHVTFKPALYGQVCRLVRNYHNMNWDAEKPGDSLHLPFTNNNINWQKDVYGPWKEHGFETDICLQFLGFGPSVKDYQQRWAGKESWAREYGKVMSAYFGPSGSEKLCTSMEIDNEPGSFFDSTLFKKLFKEMAQGIREGDPKVKILTPAVKAGRLDKYSQDLGSMYGSDEMLPLYDVINVHTYPTIDKGMFDENVWNRSFPEDKDLYYFKMVTETIDWRDKHAKDKEIWVTEFGYDACTDSAMLKRKDWALKLNWQGTTDLQQAQYLVRSFLLFSALDIQRAYLYYYDDNDEASVHAASGITRHFAPKTAFWAVKQLYQTLGEYRFRKIIQQQPGKAYVYEFVKGSDNNDIIWVAWSPTGVRTDKKKNYQPVQTTIALYNIPGDVVQIQGMAVNENSSQKIDFKKNNQTSISLTISESPVYINIKK
ncbi:hypothetical protein DVR12_05720 [Chitinophaga silvatica]|uniref:Asl1-like glycosyl hydrolase catalytic domain-containing protein n=1 Tax=Chitinophaga silvatica TaxID=2282649 RepID=A0A3E1YDX4_9BACT|nr:hypothetical protein [Chitinophaga silvatica]RFS24699.1 hypothetical protein DVR12_05720 [Chitinophaga silvatica]